MTSPSRPLRPADQPLPDWAGDPSRPVHIVCFDRREAEAWRAVVAVDGQQPITGSKFPLLEGWLDGRRVGVLRLPFGDKPDLLRAIFGAFLAQVRPTLVIVAGTCLTCRPELPLDAVVTVREVLAGKTRHRLDHPFPAEVLAAGLHGQRIAAVTALTSPVFVESAEHRRRLTGRYPEAEIIEMEDAHLAGLAAAASVPLVVIRGVTDAGNFADHMDNLPAAIARVVSVTRRFLRLLRQQTDLVEVPNPTAADLAFRIVVEAPGQALSLPQAVRWARTAVAWFDLGRLVPAGGRIDLELGPEEADDLPDAGGGPAATGAAPTEERFPFAPGHPRPEGRGRRGGIPRRWEEPAASAALATSAFPAVPSAPSAHGPFAQGAAAPFPGAPVSAGMPETSPVPLATFEPAPLLTGPASFAASGFPATPGGPGPGAAPAVPAGQVVPTDPAGPASGPPATRVHAPGGRAVVAGRPGWWELAWDAEHAFASVRVTGRWRRERGSRPDTLAVALRGGALQQVPFGDRAREVRATLALPGAYHVQGLNSISAEPEEGLLAAATIEEFRRHGLRVANASQSTVWVYRTANADAASYFHPPYALPMRDVAAPPAGVKLIATGLGPAIDPGAAGGEEAWLLLAGDEQGGRLVQYLEDLAASPFTAADVFRYDGVVQRLDDGTVAVGRLDRRLLLSSAGLDRLVFDPATVRQIYSGAYDEFLRAYFRAERRLFPAKGSFLLLTSRGCGNRCSICCSGGFQPFTALSAERVVEILRDLQARSFLRPGEYLDIFLVDSYFNRDPQRVIRLAELVEAEGLRPWFEFHVRHNGLRAFLRRTPGTPAVHAELIAAYRRLGIDEVVMGIDAYTEASIRLLKTDVGELAATGGEAPPAYGFRQIEDVLTALDEAGLRSRGFLLLDNPFLGEEDRLDTWYRLARLCLRVRRFRIDYDSSPGVNELKPFPGAPLTRVAEQVPGLIAGGRFARTQRWADLAGILEFGLFGEWRTEPGKLPALFRDVQLVRLRVVMALAGRLRGFARRERPEQEDILRMLHSFRVGEALLEPLTLAFQKRHPDLRDVESQIRWRQQGIDRLLHALDRSAPSQRHPSSAPFFALLREPPGPPTHPPIGG